jgi:hypothetical protein
MDPVSDRELGVRLAGSGGPDIEVQAVLAEGSLFTIAPLEGVTAGIVDGLEAGMTETVGHLHAVPRNDGLRSLPTEISDRRSGIRDAFVSGNTGNVGSDTLHLTTFDGQNRAGLSAVLHAARRRARAAKVKIFFIKDVVYVQRYGTMCPCVSTFGSKTFNYTPG